MLVAGLLGQDADHLGADLSFYLTGYGMAAAGILLAVVAVLTLVVGAADQLLDARPLASLTALGVDERVLEKVLRRQQWAAAVPADVLDVLAGGAAGAYIRGDNALGATVLPTLLVAAAAGGAVSLVTRLTVVSLRSRLRAATDPENLRVA